MALIPYHYRPTTIIRRRVRGYARSKQTLFWRGLLIFIYTSRTAKSFFGKSAEPIGIYRLGANHFLSVVTSVPLSRRDQRRTGITRAVLQRQAEADIRASQRDS
ncbi:MAG: hypothetical protein QNM02_20805 [Acidimicrobiia bacterium]|nr:hypothetical protein [Acidimicrobiia bacterium]